MELMPCGHPRSCVVCDTDLGGIGTCYCMACVRESEIFRELKGVVEDYREFVEDIPPSGELDASIKKAVLTTLSTIQLRMNQVEKEWK